MRLDRLGVAEMSCIAGVGGDVAPLVRTARRAPNVLAIDGCPLHCALRSLRGRGVEPTRHVDLSKLGVPKLAHQDFDAAQAEVLIQDLIATLTSPPPAPIVVQERPF